MKKKSLSKMAIVFLSLLILIINLPGIVFALGEYNGVWLGPETVTVPNYGSETEITGTVVYQEDQNTLNFWDPLFGSVDLIRSGNQWVLASPIWTTYMGYSAKITSVSITFPSTSSMTGKITAEVQGVIGIGTLSHTKQSCQNLANGVAISNISGAADSVRCYAINIPSGATNLDVQTWGGNGDCDLIQVYYRPDFDNYTSENSGNQEQITVASPPPGKWYIGVLGWESYSGVNLKASYLSVPAPVSNFTADVLAGITPLNVTFTDQSTGSITSWTWNFGDGTTSNIQNPLHTYSVPGTYTVSLTVTGPGGTDIETKNQYIVVSEVKAMPWMLLLLKNKNK